MARSAPSGPQASTDASRIAIPHFVTDPVASLRPWPIDVRLNGLNCRIPALPAADWLAVFMGPFTVMDIVPGLCPDDEADVIAMLAQGDLSITELRDAALAAITHVSGRPWWIAVRLVKIAAASWESLGGRLAQQNIDAGRISLGQWLDAILVIIVESIKPEQTTMFFSQLEMPPPGYGDELPEPEMNPATFMAMG